MAAGPATVAPNSSRCCFKASATTGESFDQENPQPPEIIRLFGLAEFMLMRRTHPIVGRDHHDHPKDEPDGEGYRKGAVGQIGAPNRVVIDDEGYKR